MNHKRQPLRLFQTDVVQWVCEAHKLKRAGVWRPGSAPAGSDVESGHFLALRVVSRATLRAGCRESIRQMLSRLEGGLPSRSHRRHGFKSRGLFQRAWAKIKAQAMPTPVLAGRA